MTKIAVVTSYFPTSTNPWEGRSAYETLRVLSSRCDVRVFCPVATYPRLLKPASRSGAEPDLTWNPPDVAATYIPYPVLPVVSRPLNGFIIARRLLPYVRRFDPDIVLNYMAYPDGYAAVRIAHALRVPAVLTAIGSDLNRMSDPLCAALTRSALRRADSVITVSRDLANTAKALGATSEKITPILNGCDTSVFHPKDRAAARHALSLDLSSEIVVYVGRLDTRKGLVELIHAIALLRAERPAVECYIIGRGPDEALLRQAAAGRNASSYIRFVPPCSSGEIAAWMAASNLVALPSYREGCPNVIIEALAAGRPVVATNVGGIPELMDESCGRLVSPRIVPELVQALREVLAKEWSATAISSKHNRNWADVAEDVYRVLKQCSLGSD